MIYRFFFKVRVVHINGMLTNAPVNVTPAQAQAEALVAIS